ncbi:hypothetical protein GCM10011339_32330 [Echinicola rosea]|uniref:Uncharacterized protein n=1 Tax=Echinicola rosea TaxID=1807691 RepID=A0ABQ1V8V6_9BACT|nr:hypothetical protein GCM10011339_32330 [Echinicola rosea]
MVELPTASGNQVFYAGFVHHVYSWTEGRFGGIDSLPKINWAADSRDHSGGFG